MYRLNEPEQTECQEQVTALLGKGHIEPSSSPYGAPVVFVQKKVGDSRMYVDYRALHKQTVKNKYPLPRIDDLLDGCQGACIFSSLDLTSGYHQIHICDEEIPKTAFRTPFGHHEWCVLSFGLTSAPATFQAVMHRVFKNVIGLYVMVYLDDILIFSCTPEGHRAHLRQVLQNLQDNILYARLSAFRTLIII